MVRVQRLRSVVSLGVVMPAGRGARGLIILEGTRPMRVWFRARVL